ncbi:MAG: RHS repeat-associated core domain-containing protein, partial [Planctomyces sp.]|nr:RHS repeat-associated core domain-containing protein [Planctomyces sp.]
MTGSGGDAVNWSYDDVSQLLTEHRTLSGDTYRHTLTYDSRGNRTQLAEDSGTPIGYTYDNANRLLTISDMSGVTTMSYDSSGNQETIEEPSGDLTTNTWDGENRLIQVEHPSGDIITYAYNGDGLRVREDDGVQERQFFYDGNNLLRELDDVGATEAEFTCLPQQAYAEVISQRRDTDSSFYLWDGISSIRQLTDDLEVVTDEYSFAAFGTLRSSTGSTANSQQYKGRLIAYRKDPNAGPETEYSLHHRNYNPATGIFKSQDPAKDDLNLYRYVKNNPVNRTDPSGLLDDDPDGEWPKFAMYGRTIEKSKSLTCERDQKIRELKAKFGSLFQSKEDFLKFFAGVRRGFYEDGLKGDIEFAGLCVEACLRYSNPVNLFNDIWRGAEKAQNAWEAAQGAAEAVAPFIVAYETSDGDFDKFFDSLTPEQQELFLSLAPLLLEIEIGLIELLGETADPELIGRIYGMILYELLVDAAIAGAVVATAGTGSGGAGAAYG